MIDLINFDYLVFTIPTWVEWVIPAILMFLGQWMGLKLFQFSTSTLIIPSVLIIIAGYMGCANIWSALVFIVVNWFVAYFTRIIYFNS